MVEHWSSSPVQGDWLKGGWPSNVKSWKWIYCPRKRTFLHTSLYQSPASIMCWSEFGKALGSRSIYIYINIYIYMCVRVSKVKSVCVWLPPSVTQFLSSRFFLVRNPLSATNKIMEYTAWLHEEVIEDRLPSTIQNTAGQNVALWAQRAFSQKREQPIKRRINETDRAIAATIWNKS